MQINHEYQITRSCFLWLKIPICLSKADSCGIIEMSKEKIMNIHIVCIGKLKEKYWQDAAAEYIKRLSRFCKLTISELPESRSDSKEEESADILAHLPKNAFVIALDVGGKRLSSEGLAKKISDLALEGRSDICFVIGGSNGFDDSVRNAADLRLSFSDFTFPHQLMRVILLEQVYRSFKIISNEKYHK